MPGRTFLTAVLSLGLLAGLAASPAPGADDQHPVVVLDTTAGPITIELDRAKAPITVDNFLKYVDKGFYDGTVFHRVIPGFMVQGGGFTEDNGILNEKRKDALPPIKNESGNGLSNARGTIAMARTSDPNSATSQFFVNLVDNNRLDNYGGGYCVFGKVTSGMEAVDAIAKAETGAKPDASGRPMGDVPTTPIVLKSAKRKSNP